MELVSVRLADLATVDPGLEDPVTEATDLEARATEDKGTEDAVMADEDLAEALTTADILEDPDIIMEDSLGLSARPRVLPLVLVQEERLKLNQAPALVGSANKTVIVNSCLNCFVIK